MQALCCCALVNNHVYSHIVQAQGFLLGIVIFMSLVCVVKVLLSLRACYQSRKQKKFVEWNSWELDDDLESAVSLFFLL